MKVRKPPEKSKGLGDTISKVTHALKIDKVVDAVTELAGINGCGCDERQEYLNKLFPYDNSSRKFKALKDFTFLDKTYKKDQKYSIDKESDLYQNIINYVRDGYFEEI